MPRVRITKTIINAARSETGRESFLWDEETPGFGVRVKGSGAVAYVIQFRNSWGRTRRMVIGKIGRMTPDEARKRARELLVTVDKGEDPAEKRQRDRSAGSVADLCKRYANEYGPANLKPSTRKVHARLLAIIAHRLGRLKVVAVDASDARRLYSAYAADTPTQAKRLLEVLSRLLSLAEEWGIRPRGSNPCTGIRTKPLPMRRRYLTGDELGRLGAALVACEADGRINSACALAVRLLLLTGMRVGEVLGLRWEYVDVERSAIFLPDSKTGAKVVPLAAPALELIVGTRPTLGTPFIIAGSKTGTATHYRTLHAAWGELCAAARIEDARIHDLRHSVASVGAGLGLGLPVIGRLLGHASSRTTQRYAHLDDDPLRAAAARIAETITAALHSGKPATPKRGGK